MRNVPAVLSAVLIIGLTAGSAQVVVPKERVLTLDKLITAEPATGVTSRRVVADTVLVTLVTVKQGMSTPHHNHPDEQVVFAQSGQIRVFVGDRQYEMSPGDIMIIPAYIEHHMQGVSDEVSWMEVHGSGFHNNPNFSEMLRSMREN